MRELGDRRADRMAPLIWRYLTDFTYTDPARFFGLICSFRYEDMMYYVVFHRTKSGRVIKYILTYYPD